MEVSTNLFLQLKLLKMRLYNLYVFLKPNFGEKIWFEPRRFKPWSSKTHHLPTAAFFRSQKKLLL